MKRAELRSTFRFGATIIPKFETHTKTLHAQRGLLVLAPLTAPRKLLVAEVSLIKSVQDVWYLGVGLEGLWVPADQRCSAV